MTMSWLSGLINARTDYTHTHKEDYVSFLYAVRNVAHFVVDLDTL